MIRMVGYGGNKESGDKKAEAAMDFGLGVSPNKTLTTPGPLEVSKDSTSKRIRLKKQDFINMMLRGQEEGNV